MPTNPLQKREVFHLAFLRGLGRSLPVSSFVLKGGSNLRFFFGSIRYSEDMDLDADNVEVHVLRDKVMSILSSAALVDTLRTFGIEQVIPPTLSHAKQTETVQRFKVHLLTSAAEDLFTKVEFSRRGLDTPFRAEPVSSEILAKYRMSPLIVPHYTAEAAASQKIRALISRRQPQARDIFDLYLLSTYVDPSTSGVQMEADRLREMRERIYSVGFRQYRDTVLSFLRQEDQEAYDSSELWDEIRLRTASLFEQTDDNHG